MPCRVTAKVPPAEIEVNLAGNPESRNHCEQDVNGQRDSSTQSVRKVTTNHTKYRRHDRRHEGEIGKFLPGQTLLAKTADLGRRQQATQIVEIVRENLAALRDSRPFDVADWTCDVEPKGRRRRKRQDNGSGTPSEAPVSSGKREES